MADFNWDDHPIVKPPTSGQFNWDDHPIVQDSEPLEVTPDMSKTESFARGAGQGATLGFEDELAGAGGALLNTLGGSRSANPPNWDKIVEHYRKTRDEERAKNKLAEETNPKTYFAGNVAGNIIPAVAAGGAGQGILGAARMGAAAGLGTSGEDLTKMDKPILDKASKLTSDVSIPMLTSGALASIPAGLSYFKNKTVPGQVFSQEATGNRIVGEDARKALGNELVQNAGNIGSDIQNELSDAARQKAEILNQQNLEGVKYDISDLNKEANKKIGNLPTSFMNEQDTARAALREPFNRAKDLNKPVEDELTNFINSRIDPTEAVKSSSPDNTSLTPKQMDSFRAALGKLGYMKDLKDSDVVSLAKRFSGKAAEKMNTEINPETGEIVKSELGDINNKISNLIDAQDIFNTGGKGVDELGNQKAVTPLLQRLESDTTSSDIARSQYQKGIDALKSANPELGSNIENKANDIATRYDLARSVSKPLTISREGAKRAAMLGAGYLGRGVNAANEGLGGALGELAGPASSVVSSGFQRAGTIKTTSNAKDIKQSDSGSLDQKFSSMGPEQLQQVANRLRNKGGMEAVAKKVDQAAQSNDPQAKAQAEFVIKQNPNAKRLMEYPNE